MEFGLVWMLGDVQLDLRTVFASVAAAQRVDLSALPANAVDVLHGEIGSPVVAPYRLPSKR